MKHCSWIASNCSECQHDGMAMVLDVLAAGFAPVKGMRHVAQPRLELDPSGPVGDRAWCLVDASRSAVLRTVQNPTLLAVVARVEGEELSLTLPTGEVAAGVPEATGETLVCDYWGREVDLSLLDGPHSELASAWLGREVQLAAAPRGGVVFGGAVTLVGMASLRDLASRSGRPSLVDEAARFRATLVVDTDEPYVEESWLGREVVAGAARLRIGMGIPRCAVVDRNPVTGERDGSLLRRLAGYRPRNEAGEPVFGVYAECVRAGVVRASPDRAPLLGMGPDTSTR